MALFKTRPSENRATRVRLAPCIRNDTLMKKCFRDWSLSNKSSDNDCHEWREKGNVVSDSGLFQEISPPGKSVTENYDFYFSTKTYVVGTQKNRLDETVLLSTQNTCLN